MRNSKNKGLKVFGYILMALALMTLMATVTMYLWNWLVPDLFNGPDISFLQSLGLLALMKLLTGFGGMGGRKWGRSHHNGGRHMWKQKWEEKMSGMSDEEKQNFKEMYYKRCGRSWNKSEEPADVEES